MSKNDRQIVPNIQKSAEQIELENAQAFMIAYKAICDKYGYEVCAKPIWAGTNHGSFELVVDVFVGKLPPKQ
jgi:hypothetical protein